MNTKTLEQREQFYKTTAASIYNFFQERKGLPFNGNCLSNFKMDYDSECKKKCIRAYRDQVAKFLSDNDSLVFKGNKCIVKINFREIEIFELIRDYNNRVNQGDKRAVSKRGIKKVVPKLDGNQKENPRNLIPIVNNVRQIIEIAGIEDIIKSLRNDFGLEIIAKQVTIKEF
jgi:hypothetical protein